RLRASAGANAGRVCWRAGRSGAAYSAHMWPGVLYEGCPLSVVSCPLFFVSLVARLSLACNSRKENHGQLTTDNGLFLSLPDRSAHLADRALQADEHSARDDVVPDVELAYLVDGGHRADVARGETVSGGDLQPRLRREDG